MLEFIRNAVFGSSRRQAASTSESKKRLSVHSKRTYSFDSKPKLAEKDQQRQRNRAAIIVNDQTSTVRRISTNSNHKTNHSEARQQDIQISINGQQTHQIEQLKEILNHFEQEQINDHHYLNAKLQVNATQRANPEDIQPKSIHLQRKSLIQKRKKLILKRFPSKKMIQKIKQRCSYCGKSLQYDDSYQMACIHRCHKNCATEMRWKMKYNCNICEIRLDQQRCAILSHHQHRKRMPNS